MTSHTSLLRTLLTHPGFKIAVLTPILALGGLATASGAKPPSCTDVPISWTFVPTTNPAAPAAILNDDPDRVYQNGVDGVFNTVIHICSGTGDATLGLQRSLRKLRMKFPAPIPSSVIQSAPPFGEGAEFTTKAFVNVRNILGSGLLVPGSPATFYTKVTSQFSVGKGGGYRLAFYPDNTTCPVLNSCAPVANYYDPIVNLPVQTAWVQVIYTPAANGSPDSWIVNGELIGTDSVYQRATLLSADSPLADHFGQYSMPFRILITALAPLP